MNRSLSNVALVVVVIILGLIPASKSMAQNPCVEAAVNLDWQWTENSPPEKKAYYSSPAEALDIYWRSFRYDPQHGLIANNPNPEQSIMASLSFGQRHYGSAQRTYTDCRKTLPSIHVMMRAVVTAAPGRACDLADASKNIAWQAGANGSSISNAKRYWTQAQTASDANAKLYFGTLAADVLMHGQMHNPPVIQEYRACFRDNPNGLFGLVFQH